MARRDRNAALAGLAALGALMYARSRKKEGSEGGEEVKPVRTTTRADEDYDKFKPTEDQYGAFGEEPTKPRAPAAPAAPAAVKPAPAPIKPAAPAAGAGRSAGIGGPTAAQMAQAAMGAGGGRGGVGGPTAAQMAQAQIGAGGGRGGVGGPRVGEREAYEASRRAPGQIPVDPNLRAPASTGEMPGETERNIRNILGATGPGAAMRAAPAVGKGVGALANSAKEGWRAGQIDKEVARAAERGAASRAQVQANRAARQNAEAQAMEEAKPILQARPGKPDVRDRTRFNEDEAGFNFKKGGKAKPKKMASGGMAKSSVSKRADGIAKRGKTRGKMY